MSEPIKSYRGLREEADLLSRLLFGDRFVSLYHGKAIEAALATFLSDRGINAFDQPYWYVSTSDFEIYQVSPEVSGAFAVRLDAFAAFTEVELWKYAIVREQEERGQPLLGREAYFAPGFLPWADTSVIAIALLKLAIRAGAPS